MILYLIPQLYFHFPCLSKRVRIGSAGVRNIVFLEEHSGSPIACSRERFAARVVAWDPLKVDQGAVSIPARKLQLRQAQQRVFGLWRKRIVHNYVLVVALRVRGIRCKACPPIQSFRIKASRRRSCRDYGIDQRSPCRAIPIAHQSLSPYKNRIRGASGRLRDGQRGRTR